MVQPLVSHLHVRAAQGLAPQAFLVRPLAAAHVRMRPADLKRMARDTRQPMASIHGRATTRQKCSRKHKNQRRCKTRSRCCSCCGWSRHPRLNAASSECACTPPAIIAVATPLRCYLGLRPLFTADSAHLPSQASCAHVKSNASPPLVSYLTTNARVGVPRDGLAAHAAVVGVPSRRSRQPVVPPPACSCRVFVLDCSAAVVAPRGVLEPSTRCWNAQIDACKQREDPRSPESELGAAKPKEPHDQESKGAYTSTSSDAVLRAKSEATHMSAVNKCPSSSVTGCFLRKITANHGEGTL